MSRRKAPAPLDVGPEANADATDASPFSLYVRPFKRRATHERVELSM